MKRIIDNDIQNKMLLNKAVLIEGVRGCGKTTLANTYANTLVDLNDENVVKIANTKAELLLNSEKPILVDEYGNAPMILNTIQNKEGKNGDYILTNSINLEEKELTKVEMKPLSLFESGESNGKISLKEICEGKKDIEGIETDFEYEKIAYALCRGGFPGNMNISEKEIRRANNEYVKELIEKDINKIDGVKRNSRLTHELLKTYTNQISSLSSDRELIDETKNTYGNVSDKTIYTYVKQLKKLFIIEEIKGWQASFRNKTTVRLSPKKFFVDPSIGTTLLNVNPNELMMNFELYEKLFENLVYRDLNVYASTFDGELMYYQDRYGLNSDFIIKMKNEDYVLVDVALSENYLEESIKHLNKFERIVTKEDSKEKKPIAKVIITSGTKTEIVEGGILVIPIGCLKN